MLLNDSSGLLGESCPAVEVAWLHVNVGGLVSLVVLLTETDTVVIHTGLFRHDEVLVKLIRVVLIKSITSVRLGLAGHTNEDF